MMEPKIKHYPEWLHEFIKHPMLRSMLSKEQDCRKELQVVYTISRTDPIAKVLFWLVIDGIRLKFQLWGMHQRLLKAEERRFIPGNFTKQEILALKACAAEKMSELTPEQEAELESVLDDPWGGS